MGVSIDRVTTPDVLRRIERYVSDRRPRRIVTVNLDYLRLARRDPVFRETLRDADLAVADGMPLVWAAKLAGSSLPERVAGLDLVERIAKHGAPLGWSVFLLGAAPGVADKAGRVLASRYPGLHIAGAYSPPMGFGAEENARIVQLVREAAPDVLFVCLGAPRQDLWIHTNIDVLGVPTAIGVGCAFDVISGNVRRAPLWMQRLGLEWLYRLVNEPARLWRRYVLHDLPVFARLAVEAARAGRSRGAFPGQMEGA
jgi:N-acetylglucosaminyldiphosphoundecaprenol N-acetyl-beta-D-mannosaminyltransferase